MTTGTCYCNEQRNQANSPCSEIKENIKRNIWKRSDKWQNLNMLSDVVGVHLLSPHTQTNTLVEEAACIKTLIC